jgi:hypothetical protein
MLSLVLSPSKGSPKGLSKHPPFPNHQTIHDQTIKRTLPFPNHQTIHNQTIQRLPDFRSLRAAGFPAWAKHPMPSHPSHLMPSPALRPNIIATAQVSRVGSNASRAPRVGATGLENARPYYQDYVKFLLAHRRRLARVGVLLVPTETFAKHLSAVGRQRALSKGRASYSGMVHFEKVRRELAHLEFLLTMPTLVAGISPQYS